MNPIVEDPQIPLIGGAIPDAICTQFALFGADKKYNKYW